MKIVICSDSHGDYHNINAAIRESRPDGVIFLGDGANDFINVKLKEDMLFAAVSGNCDLASTYPQSRILTICQKRIFLTHGHKEGVKQGFSGLVKAAKEHDAHIALYGHTHRQDAMIADDILFICPGTIKGRFGSYAILNIEDDKDAAYSFHMIK